jgi:hypothetical protein
MASCSHHAPRRSCRRPGHSYRIEVVDRVRGHLSTDARYIDSSCGGRRAIEPCGAEHRRAAHMPAVVPVVMPKVTLPPMLVVVPNVGALSPMPVVVPKVGDLPPMPSVCHVPNRQCPPFQQCRSPLCPTNATRTRWTGM